MDSKFNYENLDRNTKAQLIEALKARDGACSTLELKVEELLKTQAGPNNGEISDADFTEAKVNASETAETAERKGIFNTTKEMAWNKVKKIKGVSKKIYNQPVAKITLGFCVGVVFNSIIIYTVKNANEIVINGISFAKSVLGKNDS